MTKLTIAETEKLKRRFKRLVAAGKSEYRAFRILAEQTGLAVITVRQRIKGYGDYKH